MRARRQFGRAVIDNQAVGFELARLTVGYQALHALLADLASTMDASIIDNEPRVATESTVDGVAGALAAAGELALAATRTAMQLHGASGMVAGSPVGRYYRAAPGIIAADLPPAELAAQLGSGWWATQPLQRQVPG